MFRMYGTTSKTRMTFPDKKTSAAAEDFFYETQSYIDFIQAYKNIPLKNSFFKGIDF